MYYNGETSVEQALLVYIKQSIEHSYPLNGFADVNFESALFEAK